MKAQMTKRERVERTMACEETDRAPLYDLLRNDAAFAHFSGERLPPLAEDAATRETLHRIAAKATGAFCDMTRSVGFGPVAAKDTTDVFGFVHHHAPFEKTSWIVSRPFTDEEGAMAFLKRWADEAWRGVKEISDAPDVHRARYHENFRKTQALMGDDTVNLLAQHQTGLDSVRHLLGMEMCAYVEADEPGRISEALEAWTEWSLAECRAIADPSLSPVVLTYGDIACKGRLLHSPAWLRREFFPRLKRINDAWHERGHKCLFHSDGDLMEIMDDLVATGIDGLNPIETVAGMSVKVVRERYPRLFIAGGIDMSQLLSNGSPDEVRAVCEQTIRDGAPGLFIGSTTEADNSCRLENLIVMYEVVAASGGRAYQSPPSGAL